jgi:hypothetical protein
VAVYKSKGIVLRSIRYGEADRILDLYTRDAGLVSAIAKGIRRTKSRFGARLEPLSCVDFVAYQGRTLDTLTQAELLRSFRGVREDLARFDAAARMVGRRRGRPPRLQPSIQRSRRAGGTRLGFRSGRSCLRVEALDLGWLRPTTRCLLKLRH